MWRQEGGFIGREKKMGGSRKGWQGKKSGTKNTHKHDHHKPARLLDKQHTGTTRKEKK